MIIYISSNIPSIITLNSSLHLESSVDIKPIKIEENSSFTLSAQPLDTNNFLPTHSKLVIENGKLICNNENILIIKHNNTTYEVIVLFSYLQNNTPVYKTKLNNKNEVTLYSNEITISSEKEFYKTTLQFNYDNHNIIEKEKFVYFLFGSSTGAGVVIYDKTLHTFSSYSCDKFKLEDETLTLVRKNNDYIKSLKLTTINIKDNTITTTVARKYSSDKIATNKFIIPFAFIQAIKIKEFTLARKYLNSSFSASLEDSHLINFFGIFIKACYPKISLPPYSLSLIKKEGKKLFASHYTFEFDDENKISNIYCH